jgi:acyl-CoA dehydrogenase
LFTLVLIAGGIVAVAVLAMRRAPLWYWAVAAAALGVLSRLVVANGLWLRTDLAGWLLAVLPAIIVGLLVATPIRRAILIAPAYRLVRSILPKVSRTEQEALDAGTVGWDAELFSGRPRWEKLLSIRRPTLTVEEQAFLDGPVNKVCAMINDWDTRHNRADMPPAVWSYLKEQGFLGMLIGKEWGGLGFSAQAQSQVVSKVASRSVAAGITVMVPNSLGPGELLEKYGTEEQKKKYLPRLAKGLEVPCFALTGPHAGSDAAGMRDVGTVCWEMVGDKKTLGVRLSWDKRYITLAPVATLVGLAFHPHDPDHLIGEEENRGITLALIPADYPGVEIGRRHFPARSAFMNGPVKGRNVFIPMDFLIGGVDYAGQGWRMLMECLSTGRAISLPAIGTVSIKQALRVTSAYARIRRQFGIAVGIMEGVAEPLSRLVRSAYTYEAARGLTASMVDEGQKPAVIGALLKYRTTEAMRDRINDALDIHGGRAVQDGPSNYLFAGYMTTPVAITVEGANILTRSLITFAQGALRAHPYLYAEIAAVQNPDRTKGIADFDRAFGGHVSFVLRNIFGSLLHALSFGLFASTPVNHEMARWYRQLARYSQSFALVGDWTVAFLGGDLKRKQQIAGRLADVLSELYLLSAVLKRYEDEGQIKDDAQLVDAIARDSLYAIEQSFAGVFANFPNVLLRWLMRLLVFPLGRHRRPASDRATYKLARAVLRPGEFRDRMTPGVYVSMDPKDLTGVLEDALIKVTRAEDIESVFVRAIKRGQIQRRLDRDAITDAVEAGILTEAEAATLRLADQATDRVIKVDDFDADELAAKQLTDRPEERAAE